MLYNLEEHARKRAGQAGSEEGVNDDVISFSGPGEFFPFRNGRTFHKTQRRRINS